MTLTTFLLDEVMKNVDLGDKITISSCGLVSRQLRIAILKRAYFRLAIPTQEKITMLLDTFKPTPTPLSITYHVRECSFGQERGGFAEIRLGESFAALLLLFPHLAALEIHACSLTASPEVDLAVLKSCTFRNVGFFGVSLDAWLVRMPNVQSITIFSSYSANYEIFDNVALPKKLKTLAIGLAKTLQSPFTKVESIMTPAAGFIRWLNSRKTIDVITLETLAVFAVTDATWEDIMDIIDTTKGGLQSLYVSTVARTTQELENRIGKVDHVKRLYFMDGLGHVTFKYS